MKILSGSSQECPSLKCYHEEADDRILFHTNYIINAEHFQKVIIASPDTDVYINTIYHFTRWKFLYLTELWIISSKRRGSEQIIPVHEIIEHLDDDVIEVLPALHALTGYSDAK